MDVDVSSDATALNFRGRPTVIAMAALSALAVARVSVLWELEVGSGQPLWLGSGVVVGIALLVRRALRVPVLLAGLAGLAIDAAVFAEEDLDAVLGVMTGHALEISGGAVVFGLLFRNRPAASRSVTTLVAFLLCFAIPALAGGVAALWFSPDPWFEFLWSWTLGHGLGMAAAGALLLLLRGPGTWLIGGDPVRHSTELVVALAVTIALSWWSFSTSGETTHLVVAALLWLAVRFGPRVAVPVALLVVVHACVRTSSGAGPFGGGAVRDMLDLQAFNGAVIFSTILVGRYARGIDHERRRSEAVFTALPDVVTVSLRPDQVVVVSGERDAESELGSTVVRALTEEAPRPATGEILTVRRPLSCDGRTREIESRSVRIDRQTVVTVSRDVTEDAEIVADLRTARERWQRLATTAYEGFLEVDADATVVYATPRMAEMLAATVDDLIGADFVDLVDPDDLDKLVHQAAAVIQGERVLFETDYLRRDGRRAWCIISGEPLLGPDGEFRGAIMFAADTTDYHHEHAGRALAEVRLASIEQLERQRIARRLHDGPLQSMVALSYQLHALTRGADVEATAGRLEQLAIDSTRQMRDALEDLVPSTPQHLDLDHSLRQVAARFRTDSAPALNIDVQAETALPPTIGTGLYQIGREAIINAVLHADATVVDVCIEESPAGYTLTVVDDGSGIGTGPTERAGHLGLRAMRERATEAGGTCEVGPNGPTGTRVTAFLPRAAVPEAAS